MIFQNRTLPPTPQSLQRGEEVNFLPSIISVIQKKLYGALGSAAIHPIWLQFSRTIRIRSQYSLIACMR